MVLQGLVVGKRSFPGNAITEVLKDQDSSFSEDSTVLCLSICLLGQGKTHTTQLRKITVFKDIWPYDSITSVFLNVRIMS